MRKLLVAWGASIVITLLVITLLLLVLALPAGLGDPLYPTMRWIYASQTWPVQLGTRLGDLALLCGVACLIELGIIGVVAALSRLSDSPLKVGLVTLVSFLVISSSWFLDITVARQANPFIYLDFDYWLTGSVRTLSTQVDSLVLQPSAAALLLLTSVCVVLALALLGHTIRKSACKSL